MSRSSISRHRHILSIAVLMCAQLALGPGSAESASAPGRAAGPTAFATFAGGCFWCMEPPFEKLDGVHAVISGYMGGHKKNPTYEEVSAGVTGHAESVEIRYDAAKIGYERLLEVFWHNVDPTTADRQFCDHGRQYRPAIFYRDTTQKRLAEQTRRTIERTKQFREPIVLEITAASTFYPAEEYHQDFYKKNPAHYSSYRTGCGRDRRLRQLWGESAGH